MHAKHKKHSEAVAIGLSIICLMHCLALPLIITLLPALGLWIGMDEQFHLYLIIITLPLSLTILLTDYHIHQHKLALLLGVAGLISLIAGWYSERAITDLMMSGGGSIFLLIAHILNWKRRNLMSANPSKHHSSP